MDATVIRDPDVVRVAVVERLPEACGGGVAFPHDGLIWILLERRQKREPCEIDLDEWVALGYAAHAAGEPVTVADQARRFGTDLDTARAAFCAVAWEWFERTRCC